MWKYAATSSATFVIAFFLARADGQPAKKGTAKDFSESTIVTRMMAFDANNTGKLTKEMVTDGRLHRLFDQADANKDGVVTREELMVLAAKLEAETPPFSKGPFGPGKKGPDFRKKGPDGKGPPIDKDPDRPKQP